MHKLVFSFLFISFFLFPSFALDSNDVYVDDVASTSITIRASTAISSVTLLDDPVVTKPRAAVLIFTDLVPQTRYVFNATSSTSWITFVTYTAYPVFTNAFPREVMAYTQQYIRLEGQYLTSQTPYSDCLFACPSGALFLKGTVANEVLTCLGSPVVSTVVWFGASDFNCSLSIVTMAETIPTNFFFTPSIPADYPWSLIPRLPCTAQGENGIYIWRYNPRLIVTTGPFHENRVILMNPTIELMDNIGPYQFYSGSMSDPARLPTSMSGNVLTITNGMVAFVIPVNSPVVRVMGSFSVTSGSCPASAALYNGDETSLFLSAFWSSELASPQSVPVAFDVFFTVGRVGFTFIVSTQCAKPISITLHELFIHNISPKEQLIVYSVSEDKCLAPTGWGNFTVAPCALTQTQAFRLLPVVNSATGFVRMMHAKSSSCFDTTTQTVVSVGCSSTVNKPSLSIWPSTGQISNHTSYLRAEDTSTHPCLFVSPTTKYLGDADCINTVVRMGKFLKFFTVGRGTNLPLYSGAPTLASVRPSPTWVTSNASYVTLTGTNLLQLSGVLSCNFTIFNSVSVFTAGQVYNSTTVACPVPLRSLSDRWPSDFNSTLNTTATISLVAGPYVLTNSRSYVTVDFLVPAILTPVPMALTPTPTPTPSSSTSVTPSPMPAASTTPIPIPYASTTPDPQLPIPVDPTATLSPVFSDPTPTPQHLPITPPSPSLTSSPSLFPSPLPTPSPSPQQFMYGHYIRFLDDGLFVDIFFNTSLASHPGYQGSCSSIFTPNTTDSFGTGCSCLWFDDKSLRIVLGQSASIDIGDVLTFIVYPDFHIFPIPLPQPEIPITPNIVFEGPHILGSCAGGEYNILHTTGNAGRPWSQLYFILPLGGGFSVSTPVQTIATVPETTDPGIFEITAVARNWLGGMSEQTFFVTKYDTPIPQITISSPNLNNHGIINMHRNQTLVLEGFGVAYPSNCNGSTLPLNFAWFISPSIPSLTSAHLQSPKLVIPPFTLSSGTTYRMMLEGSLVEDPQVVSRAQISVVVGTSALQPRIYGGDVTIPTTFSYVLDGSQSFDPDQSQDSEVFEWSCSFVQQSSPCVLPSPHLPQMSLSGEFVVGDIVRVDLTYKKGFRSETTFSVLSFVATRVPVLFIQPLPTPVVDPMQRLVLTASLMSLDDPSFLYFSWNVTAESQTGPPLPASSFLNDPTDGLSVVVAPGILQPGMTYFAMLTVTLKRAQSATTTAVLEFMAGQPPSGGSCELSKQPTALDPAFFVACEGWRSSNLPLSFQPGYSQSDDTFIPISQASASPFMKFKSLPPAQTMQLQVRIVDSLGISKLVALGPVTAPIGGVRIASILDSPTSIVERIRSKSLQVTDAIHEVGFCAGLLNGCPVPTCSDSHAAKTEAREMFVDFLTELSQGLSSDPSQLIVAIKVLFSDPKEVSDRMATHASSLLDVSLSALNGDQLDTNTAKIVLSTLSMMANVTATKGGLMTKQGQQTLSSTTYRLFKQFAANQLSGALTREAPISFVSGQLSLSTQRLVSDSLPGMNFSAPSLSNQPAASFLLPPGFGTAISTDMVVVDAQVSTIGTNIYSWEGTKLVSNIVSFGVHDQFDSTELHIQGLASPILIDIPTLASTSPNSTMCVFWSVSLQTWSTDGCEIREFSPTRIKCACNHLTSFALALPAMPEPPVPIPPETNWPVAPNPPVEIRSPAITMLFSTIFGLFLASLFISWVLEMFSHLNLFKVFPSIAFARQKRMQTPLPDETPVESITDQDMDEFSAHGHGTDSEKGHSQSSQTAWLADSSSQQTADSSNPLEQKAKKRRRSSAIAESRFDRFWAMFKTRQRVGKRHTLEQMVFPRPGETMSAPMRTTVFFVFCVGSIFSCALFIVHFKTVSILHAIVASAVTTFVLLPSRALLLSLFRRLAREQRISEGYLDPRQMNKDSQYRSATSGGVPNQALDSDFTTMIAIIKKESGGKMDAVDLQNALLRADVPEEDMKWFAARLRGDNESISVGEFALACKEYFSKKTAVDIQVIPIDEDSAQVAVTPRSPHIPLSLRLQQQQEEASDPVSDVTWSPPHTPMTNTDSSISNPPRRRPPLPPPPPDKPASSSDRAANSSGTSSAGGPSSSQGGQSSVEKEWPDESAFVRLIRARRQAVARMFIITIMVGLGLFSIFALKRPLVPVISCALVGLISSVVSSPEWGAYFLFALSGLLVSVTISDLTDWNSYKLLVTTAVFLAWSSFFITVSCMWKKSFKILMILLSLCESGICGILPRIFLGQSSLGSPASIIGFIFPIVSAFTCAKLFSRNRKWWAGSLFIFVLGWTAAFVVGSVSRVNTILCADGVTAAVATWLIGAHFLRNARRRHMRMLLSSELFEKPRRHHLPRWSLPIVFAAVIGLQSLQLYYVSSVTPDFTKQQVETFFGAWGLSLVLDVFVADRVKVIVGLFVSWISRSTLGKVAALVTNDVEMRGTELATVEPMEVQQEERETENDQR